MVRFLGLVLGVASGCSGGSEIRSLSYTEIGNFTSRLVGIENQAMSPADASTISHITGTWVHWSGSPGSLDAVAGRGKRLDSYNYTETSTAGAYDYMRAYRLTPDINADDPPNDSHEYAGFLGVAARASGLTDTGVASYAGEAIANIRTYITGDESYLEEDRIGRSEVEANFVTKKVDVTIEVTNSSLSELVVTGMDIEGNSFSGGTIATTSVEGIHSGDYSYAKGYFYGRASSEKSGGPAEVGGMVVATATNPPPAPGEQPPISSVRLVFLAN